MESAENTLEAFRYALDLGCAYIETDVQLSKDGIPYIFHDDDLLRINRSSQKFSDLDSSEIEKIRIFETHPIPSLKECLQQFPNAKFNIDLKTEAVMKPALDVIQEMGAEKRICIASFSDTRIEYAREHSPSLCFSMGPKEIIKLLLKSWGLTFMGGIGDCVQVPMTQYGIKIVTPRFVQKVHELGLKIHVWTINDVDLMKHLIAIKVDGIITDQPALLKSLLDQ